MEKIEALRFAISALEKKQAAISEGARRMIPLKGSEDEFFRIENALIQLRALCQALQSEMVRKSITEWDMAIAESVEPEMRL